MQCGSLCSSLVASRLSKCLLRDAGFSERVSESVCVCEREREREGEVSFQSLFQLEIV